MKTTELERVVRDLVERVATLEGDRSSGRSPLSSSDLGVVKSLLAELPADDDGAGAVLYAGAGRGPGGPTAFQMSRPWSELVEVNPTPVAHCMAALGSPQRVGIIQILLQGPATTAQITESLDEPSAGQLFHHLKELLAAGVVYRPSRGSYAIRTQHVVPLLTMISCAIDLPAGGNPQPG